MSLFFTPSVRRGRDRPSQTDEGLAKKTLGILMDKQGFSAIRDYCIREYFPAASVVWMAAKGGLREGAAWSAGKTPPSDPKKCFEWLCRTAFHAAGDSGAKIDTAEQVRLSGLYSKGFCEIWSGPQKPYEKVGLLMRFILDMNSVEKGAVFLIHSQLRRCMTQWLNALVCDEYKKHPDLPAWDVLPSATMAGIAEAMAERLPKESIATMFTNSTVDRVACLRGSYVQTTALVKSPAEYVTAASVRKELLSKFSPGQLQMTTPWLDNGMQLNGFSWRTFGLFLERHYLMTATEKTFDKQFFFELISRGSENWSTPALAEKYTDVWASAYLEWINLARAVIPGQPNLAIPTRMTALPVTIQRRIAADTIAMWPAMVLSPECMDLASELVAQDTTLDARIKKSEFNMNVRESFDLLYKLPASEPGFPGPRSKNVRRLGEGGSSEWPIYEHLALRYADMDLENQAAPLPVDVTGYFTF
jgi:hypothetical protein